MNAKEPKYEIMPAHYLLCFSDKCPLASTCLHSLAAQSGRQPHKIIQAVNSALFCGESCPYYKENKETTIAYGMIDSYHEVKADDIGELRNTLIRHFGRSGYYRRRNGLHPIPPKEQQYISNIFHQFGYEVTFDKLIEETQWV